MRSEPNDWHAQVSAAARGSSQASDIGVLYKSFWERYLERVSVEHPSLTNAKPKQPQDWFSISAAFKSLSTYGNVFNKGRRIASEMYIDSTDGAASAVLYAALLARRSKIEEV